MTTNESTPTTPQTSPACDPWKTIGATFYRFDCHGDMLNLYRVSVESITRCGVRVRDPWSNDLHIVFQTARKKWAHPTIEDARVSFIARKRRRLGFLRAAVEVTEHALLALDSAPWPDDADYRVVFRPSLATGDRLTFRDGSNQFGVFGERFPAATSA